MALLSFIVPVYNEAENLPLIHEALIKVMAEQSPEHSFELLFINDGSTDQTNQILNELAADQRIKLIIFSRNFGKEVAISAGLAHAQGQAAIILDADLQHPPTLIPEFISRWQQGADVVVGVRNKNQGEGMMKGAGSMLFYRIMTAISSTPIVPRATDFRLVDRKVITAFNQFTERNRLARGLIDWLGFSRDYVYFDAPERQFGVASYDLRKLFGLAFGAFVNHSLFPLRIAGYLGMLITIFSGSFGLFIALEKYIFHDPWHLNFSGPASLAILLVFLVGIVLMCLGLIALYIAAIHGEVVNRPIYVVREKKNL